MITRLMDVQAKVLWWGEGAVCHDLEKSNVTGGLELPSSKTGSGWLSGQTLAYHVSNHKFNAGTHQQKEKQNYLPHSSIVLEIKIWEPDNHSRTLTSVSIHY